MIQPANRVTEIQEYYFSRKLKEVAKLNAEGQDIISLAIGVKVAVLILATIGLGTMWMAVFADVGVTVLAVLNAMRSLGKNRLFYR